LQEQLGGRAVGSVERLEQALEAAAQPRLELELGVEPGQLVADHRARIAAVAVEQRADLAEPEPEPAERDDPVQPPHVGVRVQAVARLAALRRGQQADLVVVAQRADGEPGGGGDLADASHGGEARASRSVRVKARMRPIGALRVTRSGDPGTVRDVHRRGDVRGAPGRDTCPRPAELGGAVGHSFGTCR
jgi:hypothetical protein